MGMLVDGKYYRDGEAPEEIEVVPISRQAQMSSLAIEAQKHDRELVQPYLPDGTLNPEFEKHYPEIVKDWKEQGIIKKGRKIL
jgi:hypothetical protein